MKNKEILSKEVRFSNEEEFKMIVGFIINNIKKDSSKFNVEYSQDEEIDDYFDYRKSLTIIRIDIVYDTNESITIFECIEIANIKDTNDFIKFNYSYKLIDNKLIDISLHDFI